MMPSSAIYLIEKALDENLSLGTLASCIDADYNSEVDPESDFNNNTCLISQIKYREQWFQEMRLRKVQFMDATSHCIKT